MKNPADHQGDITILGVVSRTDSERRLVLLIDVREVDACGELNCAALILPVVWRGDMPKAGARLAVTGRIVEHGGKLAFKAEKLENSPR